MVKLRKEVEKKEAEKRKLQQDCEDTLENHKMQISDLKMMVEKGNQEILRIDNDTYGEVNVLKETNKLLQEEHQSLKDLYLEKCQELKRKCEEFECFKESSKKSLKHYMEKCVEIYFEEARSHTDCLMFLPIVSSYLALEDDRKAAPTKDEIQEEPKEETKEEDTEACKDNSN